MPGYRPKPPFPIIDRAHPLVRGLVAAWTWHEGAGQTVRSAIGRHHLAGTNLNWASGRYGTLGSMGTTGYAVATNHADLNPTRITIAARFLIESYPSGFPRIVSKDATNTDSNQAYQLLVRQVEQDLRWRINDGGTWFGGTFASVSLSTWYDVVATYDGTELRCWINGVDTNTPFSHTGSILTTDADDLGIGGRHDGQFTFAGLIDYVYIANRAWTPGEIRTFIADPFALVRPPMPLWVVAAGDGGTTLSVSVSDSVTVGESVGATVSDPQTSVSDSSTVSESVTAQLVSFASVEDSTTVSESVAALLISHVNTSDSATLSESVSATVSDPQVSVADSATVGESVGVSVVSAGDLSVNVSDSATVDEAVTAQLLSFVDVSDAATVSESVTARLLSFVDVGDSATLSESVGVSVVESGTVTISVSDSVTLTESVTATVSTAAVAVSDGATVAETITAQLVSFVGVSESTTVGESVDVEIPIAVAISESATVAESVSVTIGAVLVSVSDGVTVTDTPNIGTPSTPGSALSVSVSDGISIAESFILAGLMVPDTLVLAESMDWTLTMAESMDWTLALVESGGANS